MHNHKNFVLAVVTYLDQIVTSSEAAICLLSPMDSVDKKENENGQ